MKKTTWHTSAVAPHIVMPIAGSAFPTVGRTYTCARTAANAVVDSAGAFKGTRAWRPPIS